MPAGKARGAGSRRTARWRACDTRCRLWPCRPRRRPVSCPASSSRPTSWLSTLITDCARRGRTRWCVRLSKVERGALEALEGLIDRMSGPKNAHLWTRAALCDSAQWSRVRQAARAALEAFGWELEVPPSRLYEYIEW